MDTAAAQTTERPSNAGRAVRLVCWLGLAYIMLLGAASVLLHYQVDAAPARAYFSDEEIQIGLDYSFQRKLIGWSNQLVSLLFLAVLALTPLGPRLIERLQVLTRSWFLTVLATAVLLYLAQELLALPFGILGFLNRRDWGMTERSLYDWFIDFFKSLGVAGVFALLPLVGVYLLMRWKPRGWWVLASVGAILFGVAAALLHPILIDPLFNTFTPLEKTKWAPIEPKVRSLVAQAGLAVGDVLVMDASRQGSHSNAYFTGFGATRRIVLYDTLLKNHTEDETLSILAHEIGHWRHDHIVKGLALASVAALVGCFLLSRLLLALLGRAPWRLHSPSDPRGMPLVLLLFLLASWLLLPIQNTVSRYFENQADAASLELAQKPDAFVGAEIQLCRTNKSNVTPHPVNVFFFSTHPTALDRILRGLNK